MTIKDIVDFCMGFDEPAKVLQTIVEETKKRMRHKVLKQEEESQSSQLKLHNIVQIFPFNYDYFNNEDDFQIISTEDAKDN